MGLLCLVTEEFTGLTASGGIGACSRGLASFFSSEALDVDVIITGDALPSADLQCVQDATGISNIYYLTEIAKKDTSIYPPVDAISKAYAVYRFLKSKEYKIVYFTDWLGSGFYCTMARRQGAFNAFIVTYLHGSSEWVRRHNLYLPSLEDMEREAIERSQIENSDLVISPSEYLLDWYRAHGVQLPVSEVQSWILPQWNEKEAIPGNPLRTRELAPHQVRELIFFGRQERRKGFELFVEALGLLSVSAQLPITFLGRFDRIDREFTGSYLFRKLPNYAGRFKFINDYAQEQAIGFIMRSSHVLCIMPSIIENSPCVVGECLTVGAPFLATAVGGTPEMFLDSECLVAPLAADLASAIERIIERGATSIRSRLETSAIQANWRKHVESVLTGASDRPIAGMAHIMPKVAPLVSVCLVHHDRPHLLAKAISALQNQTYSEVEIILVDDGSKKAGSHTYLDALESSSHRIPIKLIRSENHYLGAARNLAAKSAKGEYLLFHDDDNIAEPNEIEAFVRAASHSNLDIITSQAYVFHSDDDRAAGEHKILYYPIGIGGTYSFFRNRFGDANALVKRSVFELLGGFTELRGVGWEDWEFFLRAYLKGCRIGVVPEPLFSYRASLNGMLATGNVTKNHERLFELIDKIKPELNSDLLRYTQRDAIAQQTMDRTWHLLAREIGSDLHQQLTALDPNSKEARTKLADLAFKIGRVDDAIELVISDFEMREHLIELLRARGGGSLGTRSKSIRQIETGPSGPIVCVSGWLIGINSSPDRFEKLILDGEHYRVIGWLAVNRPDVKSALSLPSGADLGFIAFARKELRRTRTFSQYFSLGGDRYFSLGVEPSLDIQKAKVWSKSSGLRRGHIDSAIYYDLMEIDLPPDWDNFVEIEIPKSAEFGVSWRHSGFDFGKRISGNIKRFESNSQVTGDRLNLILPTNTIAHVWLGLK